jgi:hypothetical protein
VVAVFKVPTESLDILKNLPGYEDAMKYTQSADSLIEFTFGLRNSLHNLANSHLNEKFVKWLLYGFFVDCKVSVNKSYLE